MAAMLQNAGRSIWRLYSRHGINQRICARNILAVCRGCENVANNGPRNTGCQFQRSQHTSSNYPYPSGSFQARETGELSEKECIPVLQDYYGEEELEDDVVIQDEVRKEFLEETADVEEQTTLDDIHKVFLDAHAKSKIKCDIDVCLFLGWEDKALEILNEYRRKRGTLDVEVYNDILHAFARKGNYHIAQALFDMMNESGGKMKPNIQSHSAMIEAYYQAGDLFKVREVINHLAMNDYRVERLFQDCILSEEQSKSILNAIQTVYPDYEPECGHAEQLNSTNPLTLDYYYAMENPDLSHTEPDQGQFPTISDEDIERLFDEQLNLELGSFTNIQSIEKKEDPTKEDHVAFKKYEDLKESWRRLLAVEIEKEKAKISRGDRGKGMKGHVPYLHVLDAKDVADIVVTEVTEVIRLNPTEVYVGRLSSSIGRMLGCKYRSLVMENRGVLKKLKQVYLKYMKMQLSQKETATNVARHVWNDLNVNNPTGASCHYKAQYWPKSVNVYLGCFFLDLLVKVAKVKPTSRTNRSVPALYHSYRFSLKGSSGMLVVHPYLVELSRTANSCGGQIRMLSRTMPMLIPPRPWVSVVMGGYLTAQVLLMKINGDAQPHLAFLNVTPTHEMSAVFDSLTMLGSVAWQVNTRILDLMIQLFNGEGDSDLQIEGPNLFEKKPFPNKRESNPDEIGRLVREHRESIKLHNEQLGLRMTTLYKLSLGNHYRDKLFWFPCNLDFRGRAYPSATHLSHVNNDVSRGMIKFARGCELGPNGLNWLMIQAISLHGILKKATNARKLEYAKERLDDIMDCADRPFEGCQWWKEADDPWQFLACCMEITDAVRSPDHTKFISHLPIQQDGSCNGLQHYAALGLDEYGAQQVNVLPSDKPMDIYQEVANLVDQRREKHANDPESKFHEIAKTLDGHVSRKVVKQTVMTYVYGVTFIGAREQIKRQLKDRKQLSDQECKDGSIFLTFQVFDSIQEMFHSARAIQNWLTDAAATIALTGNVVHWKTPINLPVVQNYRRKKHVNVFLPMQNLTFQDRGDPTSPPDLARQKCGFPPNFIHSLDSTHMMLTALYCQKAGITFASVHDCFWTHAKDVEVLNKITRDQFVSLHSMPILQNLHEHFVSQYKGLVMRRPLDKDSVDKFANFRNLPQRGSFDLTQVKDSTYFFS